MEYSARAPRAEQRADHVGFPLAFFMISLLTLVMLKIAPSGDPTSPYSVWGWRIPFFVGGLISLAFVVYFARQVEESEVFEPEGGAIRRRSRSWSRPTRAGTRPGVRADDRGLARLNTAIVILPEMRKDTVGLSHEGVAGAESRRS